MKRLMAAIVLMLVIVCCVTACAGSDVSAVNRKTDQEIRPEETMKEPETTARSSGDTGGDTARQEQTEYIGTVPDACFENAKQQGQVTEITWYQFIYNLDYIKYFLPMSGDCWIMGTYGGLYHLEETVDYLENMLESGGWQETDFRIFQGIGTSDPIWDQTDSQIQEMFVRERFTPENLHYAIIENGRHDIDACERYLYYGLQDFFGQTETSAENAEEEVLGESDGEEEADAGFDPVNRDTKVLDVIHSPVFEEYGRLLFPTDRTISDDLTLENVESILTWYNDVNPDKTVEIVNYLGEQAASGNQVFFDIYTEEEKAEDHNFSESQ